MNPWLGCDVPRMRLQSLYGDRLVRCFESRPASLLAMFEAACAAQPSQEAVVCEGERWTFDEARAVSIGLAAGFAALGLAAGQRVILLVGNSPAFVFALLALQRLGVIAVPVGVREARPGVAYIARHCEATAIVHDDALVGRVPDALEAPTLRHRLAVSGLGLQPHRGLDVPSWDAGETDVAVILYTSGTTGNPKGAMLTHLALVHSAMHYQVTLGLRAGDRAALAVPASHVTGLVAIIAAMWQVGGAVVIVPEFKADPFVRLMQTERISYTLMVPAMYQLCLMAAAFAQADLSAWRLGGYGGAPMPVATIDSLSTRLPGLALFNAYGATETSSPATLMPVGLTRAQADSVGLPLPAADIRVMDENGCEVPPGTVGELWIGGPMVVPGYWNDPEATRSAFTAGYWHSGDLGSIDALGFVRVFDRKKDMLNRGGYKVYSVEVENALMAWPGVAEAAVVGSPCPVLGERVHAFVHAPGIAADTEGLLGHCAARLADYKVPESITWSPNPLPRNANGKLLKRVLREGLTALAAQDSKVRSS
jgi:O-succinylbenzoic acid--CoA ligase